MRHHPKHPYVVFTHRVELMPEGITTVWAIINWCNQVVGEPGVQWAYECSYHQAFLWWFKNKDVATQFQLTWGGALSEQ